MHATVRAAKTSNGAQQPDPQFRLGGLLARDGSGWIEPNAVVDYVEDDATAPENFEYHMLRWCRRWIDDSARAFCRKWKLSPDDPAIACDLRSLHSRRRRATARARRVAGRVGGRWSVRCADAAVDWWIDRVLRPRHDSEAESAAP